MEEIYGKRISNKKCSKCNTLIEVIDNRIIVTVNHVMEEDHFIEWIAMSSNNKIIKKFLLPNEKASVIFPYVKGSKIYSFCNKHGLWAKDIE